MRIALTSDLHIFTTKPKHIEKMFQNLSADNPDVTVIAGDHNGGMYGYKGARAIFEIARRYYKGPIIACLGNHEYWVQGTKIKNVDLYDSRSARYVHPRLDVWMRNYETIVESAKEHQIHLLEEDGVFRWNSVFAIAGHGLWYANPPNSNDALYMPLGVEGDTHRHMYKKTTNDLLKQLDTLTSDDIFRIFVSHFPVVEIEERDREWAGDPGIGTMLMEQYGFNKFLNGHTHHNRSGPLRYECGSDYYNPKYKIIEV
jgi:predicted MPP superfamily phosphohydrolase